MTELTHQASSRLVVSSLLPGLAIAVLAILYGVIVGLGICLPLAVRLENRAGEQGSQS